MLHVDSTRPTEIVCQRYQYIIYKATGLTEFDMNIDNHIFNNYITYKATGLPECDRNIDSSVSNIQGYRSS